MNDDGQERRKAGDHLAGRELDGAQVRAVLLHHNVSERDAERRCRHGKAAPERGAARHVQLIGEDHSHADHAEQQSGDLRCGEALIVQQHVGEHQAECGRGGLQDGAQA